MRKPIKRISPIEPIIEGWHGPYELEGNGGISPGGGDGIDGGTTLLEGWNIEGAGLR